MMNRGSSMTLLKSLEFFLMILHLQIFLTSETSLVIH
jgi:hypothetical protein